MKNVLILSLAFALTVANASAQNEMSCSPQVILSGTLNNRTFDADTVYLLRNCVEVPSGKTIILEPGVLILGEKATNGSIVFRKGSYLVSQATYDNPAIWTSNQEDGEKTPGDWAGLAFEGDATNNQSNSITISNRKCSITGGGTDDDDSSGVLKYMRVEYAKNAMTMVSLGRKTVVDYIQASYSSENAFELLGGTVRAKHLVSLNSYGADIVSNFGNRSLVQHVVTIRLDPDAHLSTGDLSNSIVISNNETSMGGYSGTPATHPVFTNVTILGPRSCEQEEVNGDFMNGVLFQHNAQGGIYNSIINGWVNGLSLFGTEVIDNANDNYSVNVAENTFLNNTNPYTVSSWTMDCASTIDEWMDGSSPFACKQLNNQFDQTYVGLSETLCDDFCGEEFVPDFVLSESGMFETNFASASDLSNAFFDQPLYRGAFDQTTDWTLGWTEFCPGPINYCALLRSSFTTGISNSVAAKDNGLNLSPNPSTGMTYAEFTAQESGTVSISIINNLGQTVRTSTDEIEKGKCKVGINTTGLSSGVYILNVEVGKGNNLHTRLMVKQ